VNDEGRSDCFDVRSVQIGVLDVVQESVAPVKPIGAQVNRQPIGPAERQVLENLAAGAVRVRPADVGRSVPLREENETTQAVRQ
jgi:hypothetical protein